MVVLLIGDKDIKVIKLYGDYYSRGDRYVELCKNLCISQRGIDEDILYQNVKKFIPAIKKYDKALLLEMQGIADGAGLTLEDIVLLNVRSELMNKLWGIDLIHEGCTTFTIKSADNNKLFMAQTWDWVKESLNRMILIVEKDSNSNTTFMTITEAGIIGNVGMNSKGNTVLLNYTSVLETTYSGAPYHIILRRALESKDLIDLEREMIRSPVAFAIHVLACGITQAPVSYEITSTGIDKFVMEDMYLIHTNHIISKRLKCRSIANELYKDSKLRYSLAEEKLKVLATKNNISIDDIQDVISTHGCNASICKHFTNDNGYEMGTIFSVVTEYDEENYPKVYLSFGEPCKNQLQRIRIDELFDCSETGG